MKTGLILFVLLFTSSSLPQQYYYTFSELNGMEDQSSNTHLFYRMFTYQKISEPFSDYIDNSIHHFDLNNNVDSFFLWSGQNISYESTGVTDLEFWNNDPAKYIYCGFSAVVDPVTFIKRYDKNNSSFTDLGAAENLEISRQNDSLIFANINNTVYVSNDGARNWDTVNALKSKQLISLNPFDDNILFLQDDNKLLKSVDKGSSYSVVDTAATDYKFFLYDKDENHIYRIGHSNGENYLSISNNKGNAYSWSEKLRDESQLYISADYSQSGTLYLAQKKNILVSSDFGTSFNLYKTLDRKIVGIYKKPNSNILYAATKYDLYEITPDTIINKKHLALNPGIISFYPLQVGNKWVYSSGTCIHGYPINCTGSASVTEVIGDTIMPNNKKYFILRNGKANSQISLERIDSSTAKVYRYNLNQYLNDDEYLIDDLLAEKNDTINNLRFSDNVVCEEDSVINIWGADRRQKIFREFILLGVTYSLVEGIGLYSFSGSSLDGYSEVSLKGAVINGVLYGDTTLTAIDENENNIPTNFSLSQNYPNPFNPTTKIKYAAPPNLPEGEALIQIKVYDVLGNEIATLVNKEQSPGEYEVEFNGSNLSSGIYFYRLSAGSFIQTKKMIYLK